MFKTTAIAAVLALSLGGTAYAQNVNANNLVSVSLSEVIDDIAVDLSVEENQIPVTIQVPIGVAATVCGTQANLLAADNKNGDAKCTAESTSQALNQAVQKQM